MRALAPAKNAPAHDLVMTPPALARRIVEHFTWENAPEHCLDPCRGDGAFYDAMKAQHLLHGTVAWCELTEGEDFFTSGYADPAHNCWDWVITNPPWSKLRSFLTLSMAISKNIVFLATLTHFCTKARLKDIRDQGFGLKEALLVPTPPKPWPGSGFQLAAVHLQLGWTGPLTFSGEPG